MNQFSAHLGIVNLFPLMFGKIEDKERVVESLKVLGDNALLLSEYGIRSLSKKD